MSLDSASWTLGGLDTCSHYLKKYRHVFRTMLSSSLLPMISLIVLALWQFIFVWMVVLVADVAVGHR